MPFCFSSRHSPLRYNRPNVSPQERLFVRLCQRLLLRDDCSNIDLMEYRIAGIACREEDYDTSFRRMVKHELSAAAMLTLDGFNFQGTQNLGLGRVTQDILKPNRRPP